MSNTGNTYCSVYPKLDAHTHFTGEKSVCVETMDVLNVRAVLGIGWSELAETSAILEYESQLRAGTEEYPGRFRFCATFNVTHFAEPSYADTVIAKLTDSIDRHGAVAVKMWKDVGMMLKDARGQYLFCDDARFSPIFDFLGRRGIPVILHIADPLAGWLPLDPGSPHYGYFKAHPEYHWHGRDDKPSHDTIIRHRDALIRAHPNVTFVCAHLASLAHDLDRLARFLDTFPNAMVDTAARTEDLRRHPVDEVRAFFAAYQDRILYGTDWEVDADAFNTNPSERHARIDRRIDSAREELRFYEETLALPEPILRKFYWENAMPVFGFPQDLK
jgi:predicted TIM-barrel fold metal-dependent hydrolase